MAQMESKKQSILEDIMRLSGNSVGIVGGAMLSARSEAKQMLRQMIISTLQERDIPSREEIEVLKLRVTALEEELAALKKSQQ